MADKAHGWTFDRGNDNQKLLLRKVRPDDPKSGWLISSKDGELRKNQALYYANELYLQLTLSSANQAIIEWLDVSHDAQINGPGFRSGISAPIHQKEVASCTFLLHCNTLHVLCHIFC